MSDATRPSLASPLWWRDLASRLLRQGVQFLIPVVALAKDGEATKGLNYGDIAIGLGVALLVTVLRTVANLRAADSAPLAARVVDRAAAAAAGTFLGLAFVGWDDAPTIVHGLDWENVLAATVASAVLAVLSGFADPGVPAGTDTVTTDPTPTDATVVQHDDTTPDPGTRYGGPALA